MTASVPMNWPGKLDAAAWERFSRRSALTTYRQRVAIKIIGAGLVLCLRNWSTVFRAERQILAFLSHPNIARLLDGGLTPSGVPYLVMEFIEGEPIDCFVQDRHLNIHDRLGLFLKSALPRNMPIKI